MCLTGNLYQSNYNRIIITYGYAKSILAELRHCHVLDTEMLCLNALVFTALKRTLVFFEERMKEKVSALKSEQSTTVRSTEVKTVGRV